MSILTSRVEVNHNININNPNDLNNGSNGPSDGSLGDNSTEQNLDDEIRDSKHILKDILTSLKESFTNLNNKNNSTSIAEFTRSENGLVRGVQNGSNMLSTVMNDKTGVQSLVSGLNNGSSLLTNMSKFFGNVGLGALSGPAIGLGAGLAVGGAVIKGLNAAATQTEKALPGMDKAIGLYDDGSYYTDVARASGTSKISLSKEMDSYVSLMAKNRNTGINNESFINLMNSLGSVGYTSDRDKSGKLISGQSAADKTANLAATIASSAYGLGMDVSDMAQFAQYVERYGGGNSSAVIGRTFQNAQASGLTRGQASEFFDGLSRVLEEGLSKGFTKSAAEVSKGLAGLGMKNSYWQGEVGIDRYLQASNAMASNTSLSTSSNMLMYRAMQNANPNASWTEIMQKMEEGNWEDESFQQAYKSVMEQAYGGDKDSIMAAIKENFGTSWQGASQIYDTIFNGKAINVDEASDKQSSNTTLNTEYTEAQDTMSQTEAKLAHAGYSAYRIKVEDISKVVSDCSSTLDQILNFLDNGNITAEFDMSRSSGRSSKKAKNGDPW